MSKLTRILLRSAYALVLLGGLGLGIAKTNMPSSPAIASYSTFTRPNPKLSNWFAPEYHSRFYPQPQQYLHKTTVHWRRRLDLSSRKRIQKSVIYVGPNYKVTSARKYSLRYLKPNYPIWVMPFRPGVKYSSSTNGLAKSQQEVELIKQAKSKHHTFYEIISGGYVYGWVPKAALVKSGIYQIPYHYYSQLQPFYAPDACEAVSLRMALSAKGHDPRISMQKFINRIPRNKNPNKGYNHNPYTYGSGAAIYPKALAKYARRYDKHSYAYTGISKHTLIYELKHGNPIVFEGSYHMKDIDSDHTLVLVGYSHGDLKFADPFYQVGWAKPISWVSIHKFTKLFHQPLRGARAVVIK